MSRSGYDLEPLLDVHTPQSLFVHPDYGHVASPDDQERRRLHAREGFPARSGRPPRETTAPTSSGRSAAATRAAPAPVLAPKYPTRSPRVSGWLPSQSVAP